MRVGRYWCASCGASASAAGRGDECPNCGQVGTLVFVAEASDPNVIDGQDRPYAWDLPEEE